MSKTRFTNDYDQLVARAIETYRQAVPQNLTDWVIDMATQIQQIPSPTFDEEKRAGFVLDQFQAFKLDQITMDERYNVYGRLAGQQPDLPALMIAAHTDTVFDHSVDLTIRRQPDRICGPGFGDNSLGVAGMLGLIKSLRDQNITPRCDIVFVATTGEEGLGDLRGMRAAFETLKHRIAAVLNLEGLAYGYIYNAGTAVRRFKIKATTGGGHSWAHFGRESAIHGLVELGHRILAISVPESPRTTYNIGIIEGGLSINTIAADAQMWLDMRSEADAALADLEAQVKQHISALQTDSLHFSTEIVSDRPSGRIAHDHPLVQLAVGVLTAQDTEARLDTSSTDGNIPLSQGCPTVTIGMTVGGNAHRTDEFAEIAPIHKGLEQLWVLAKLATDLIDQF